MSITYILSAALWLVPAGGTDGLDEARKLADAKDPRDREKAARAVLEHPDARAAQLLIALAADEHAGVRQEAIHSMRKLTGDDARGLVLKAAMTARHPFARAAACEAAGAYAPATRWPVLQRALRDGKASVRAAAARALAEGAVPSEAIGAELVKRLKDRDAAVRCAAIESLALLDPAAASAGLALLQRDRAPEVRVARLLAAQRLADRAVCDGAAVVALSDRHWTVQATAMAILAESEDRMVAASLIAALRAVQGRLQIDCTRALQKLTGKQIGPDADLWQAWLAAQWGKADGFGLQAQPKRTEPATQATFFSIPLDARNVTFILDLSKSMGDAPTAGAPPRIETARLEIARTVRSLPADARVNAITFGKELEAFAPKQRLASPGVRAALVQWVKKQPIGGGTNIYDSLELALRDKSVDAIYLLTDGGASTGAFIDNGDILEQIGRRNRYRRVHIHTIAVGRTSRGRSLLKQLAEQSGGTYVER